MSMIYLLTERGAWKNHYVSALHHNNSRTVLRAGPNGHPFHGAGASARLQNQLLRHGLGATQSVTMGPQEH